MTSHRGRECRAFLNVLASLQKDLLEILVLLLLGQDLETLHERQTRVDHHRKLARKHRQVFRLNFPAAANLRNADLATLLLDGSKSHLLASQNLTQRFTIVGDTFADHDLVQSVAPFENIRRHSCKLRLSVDVGSDTNWSALCVRTRVWFPTVARVDAGATIDQLAQLVDVRRTLHGGIQSDLALVIERGQCLVESLHAVLVLASLHHRIDLVDFVFTNQISNSALRHEDLERHRTSASFSAR